MAQYYQQYINGYADVAGLLYDMLKEDRPAIWRQAQQEAFDIIKNKLTTEPIRAHPDFNKPFKLYINASDTGLRAVLASDIHFLCPKHLLSQLYVPTIYSNYVPYMS